MGDVRDKTTKWLWSIAPSHMKEGNKPDEERDSYKLFSVWAKNTEEFKKEAYKVRRNRFPQYANPDSLRLLGKERGIEPYMERESLEDYRKRVISALEFWQKAGSVRGIKEVLKNLGFENIEIKRVGGDKWAEFVVELSTQDRQITLTLRDFLIELINTLKPAHEKLAELILSYLVQGKCNTKTGILGETVAETQYNSLVSFPSQGKSRIATGTLSEIYAYTSYNDTISIRAQVSLTLSCGCICEAWGTTQ